MTPAEKGKEYGEVIGQIILTAIMIVPVWIGIWAGVLWAAMRRGFLEGQRLAQTVIDRWR